MKGKLRKVVRLTLATGVLPLVLGACVQTTDRQTCHSWDDYVAARKEWRSAGIPASKQPKFQTWRCGDVKPKEVAPPMNLPGVFAPGNGGGGGGGGGGGAQGGGAAAT